MRKYFPAIILFLAFIGNISCYAQETNSSNFVPDGHVIYETIYGDLNKDGLEDCILIIKGTDKENIVVNRFDQEVDRNRRGIIVLFKKNDTYELAVKNENCFFSENEDGGVYYAPELSIYVENEKLYIHYSHGRYGYWKYTFRFQDSDFKLIGFDSSSNHGPIVNKETSINFLTKKKIISENTNENAEGGDEIFVETMEKITLDKLVNLSEIENFEELDSLIMH